METKAQPETRLERLTAEALRSIIAANRGDCRGLESSYASQAVNVAWEIEKRLRDKEALDKH